MRFEKYYDLVLSRQRGFHHAYVVDTTVNLLSRTLVHTLVNDYQHLAVLLIKNNPV
jgi:hypothetical protein